MMGAVIIIELVDYDDFAQYYWKSNHCAALQEMGDN